MNRFVGDISFNWFFAEVIDVNDTDKLGQYKIRIRGFHDAIVDEDLPWAMCVMPVNSASYKRENDTDSVGISPTGILVKSLVLGFFADGTSAKVPIILGTLPTIQDGDVSKHDVPKAAREINVWESRPVLGYEPQSAYAARYPHNKVFRTESGHTIEIDDTPEAPRIHVYHKSGSYTEMRPDGTVVSKSVKDKIDVTQQDNKEWVNNNNNVTIQGDSVTVIRGNMTINVGNDIRITGDNININGTNITMTASNKMVLTAPTGSVSIGD